MGLPLEELLEKRNDLQGQERWAMQQLGELRAEITKLRPIIRTAELAVYGLEVDSKVIATKDFLELPNIHKHNSNFPNDTNSHHLGQRLYIDSVCGEGIIWLKYGLSGLCSAPLEVVIGMRNAYIENEQE